MDIAGMVEFQAAQALDVGVACYCTAGMLAEQCFSISNTVGHTVPLAARADIPHFSEFQKDQDLRLKCVLDALSVLGERTTPAFSGFAPLKHTMPEVSEFCNNLKENYDRWPPAARRAVDEKLRHPDVASVFRSLAAGREEFDSCIKETQRILTKKADELIARKGGLAVCGLPSCGKQELTLSEFPMCGACREAKYCCKGHQAEDWRAHKKVCAGRKEKGEKA